MESQTSPNTKKTPRPLPLYYTGRVRLFVQKIEKRESWSAGHELFDSEHFDDSLNGPVTRENYSPGGRLSIEIEQTGWDSFREAVDEILEPYPIGAVVEIMASACIEDTESHTQDGTEYDTYCWLEESLSRQLTAYEVNWRRHYYWGDSAGMCVEVCLDLPPDPEGSDVWTREDEETAKTDPFLVQMQRPPEKVWHECPGFPSERTLAGYFTAGEQCMRCHWICDSQKSPT